MAGQDDKFVIIDRTRFKYAALRRVLAGYGQAIKLPQGLRSTMNDYGSKRIFGIRGAEQLEEALREGSVSIITDLFDARQRIDSIISYDSYRAERKYEKFQRWRKKENPQLPSELESAAAACEQAQSDENLYCFEQALGKVWMQVECLPERKDELRLIACIDNKTEQ